MKKSLVAFSFLLCLVLSNIIFAQTVKIGPRLTGNFTIYNEKGDVNSWNGIGVGIGGNVDVSFSQHIGLLVNLTVFDMRNFSTSVTNGNVNTDASYALSYLVIDPMFKAEFSGFYMVAGPSLGIKLGGSGERVDTQPGAQAQTTNLSAPFKSARFDIATGTGYNFKLSPNMDMGTDFMAYIPLSKTFDFPGVSNSTFTLKFGVALKFKI